MRQQIIEKTPGWMFIIFIFILGISTSLLILYAAQASAADLLLQENTKSIEQSTSVQYLGVADMLDAPYAISPTIDGKIDPGEYAGAARINFPGYNGDVEVFVKQNANDLFIAMDSADTTLFGITPGGPGPAMQVFLDVNNDKASTPQTDDYRLTLQKNGITKENRGNGSSWGLSGTGNWSAAAYVTSWGWQGEFQIAFSKLGITPPSTKTIGISLAEVWTPSWPKDWYWPATGHYLYPSTWGNISSSSNWDTFYWKPGPYEDYAPSGVPDFDELIVAPSFGGPAAMANSLWWFDLKVEDHPVGPTQTTTPTLPVNDSYTLIKPYGNLDDHDPGNVISLTLDLGNYFGTDTLSPGTNIYNMYSGIQNYLRDRGLWDDYVTTLVNQPDFNWIAQEVMRSEDVILLLGFWQDLGGGNWVRISGNYVTVAGVDAKNQLIAFSDPALDAAEAGGLGRVLNGSLYAHNPYPHSFSDHMDAGNVSHDIYQVMHGSTSPGGIWYLPHYNPSPILLATPGMNPNRKFPTPWPYNISLPVQVEIEYALAVSPFDWKASGRWIEDATVALYNKSFIPYNDFAPAGVPDFDQKQDSWGQVISTTWRWTLCGPVAAANSLWWFDSKFEFAGATPPAISDSYPLITSYGTWDDHNPQNMDNPATVWQPGGEFAEDLATIFDADGSQTSILHNGVTITDLYTGMVQYISNHDLQQGFVITKVQKPDYWWIAEEVERSEDVILLLGFYANLGEGNYQRAGGHYVTVAGVDKAGGYVAFSDPYWDRMESILPPNEVSLWPIWSGRVASDGDPPLGSTGLIPTYTHSAGHSATIHNDSANVSHDLYPIVNTSSPGGVWGPNGYATVGSIITNFVSVNGPGTNITDAIPIETEVEWAVAVSPVSDLWITKTITPTDVSPGQTVTITLQFGNNGNLAEDVIVSDVLSTKFINAGVLGSWNNYGGTITPHDHFTFTVGDIPFGINGSNIGIITITAQIDPNVSWPISSTITNTAIISSDTQEQYQLSETPNTDSITLTIKTAQLSISKVADLNKIATGEQITYTIIYTNLGPGNAINAVITDIIPVEIINSAYTYENNYGGTVSHTGSYIWSLGNIPNNGNGKIFLTGIANIPPGNETITNTVSFDCDSDNQGAAQNSNPVALPVYFRYFLPYHDR